jgi:hypothetical protein
MNYLRIYNEIILRSQIRVKPDGYFERHHVVPKSMGGSDDKSNLTCLTAREHFIAHYLLARIYGGAQWGAIILMKSSKHRYLNSRLYQNAKVKLSEHKKGVPLSIETRMKMSASKADQTGNKNHMFGRTGNKNHMFGKTHSHEARAKIIEARARQTGDKHPMFGKKHTDETLKNLSDAKRGKKISVEHIQKRVASRIRNKLEKARKEINV